MEGPNNKVRRSFKSKSYLIQNVIFQYIQEWEKYILWCLWWVGLGVLSSVGLGTGLHTFLLYLGPHIAAVTLAAYECGSTDFPSPPYPDAIICPEEDPAESAKLKIPMTIWMIMSKVRVEAFCWGAVSAKKIQSLFTFFNQNIFSGNCFGRTAAIFHGSSPPSLWIRSGRFRRRI